MKPANVMPRILFASVVFAAALAVSAPASAQLAGQPRATFGSSVGVHLFGMIESESMSAKKSFDAVLAGSAKNNLRFFGAGFEVTRVWKGVFGRFSATRSSNTGSRIFVDSLKQVHSLNVPITVAITPIEIGGGWRIGDGLRRVVPYVGAAILLQRYQETSETGNATDNVEVRDRGLSYFGGVDIGIGRIARAGVEGFYRNVPNAIGAEVTGASTDFAETNLGGVGFRVLFGVGF